jgi:pimeloyl-ACP methyl ester carboxylesterase
MVDLFRRKLLKTGAAATAMAAAAKGAPAQQPRPAAGAGAFYEKGSVRIYYEEYGSGFPLLLIAGGGLGGSTIRGLTNPFDAVGEFKGEYRCVGSDLRTANGKSSGPLEVGRHGTSSPTITSVSWTTSASTSSWCWASASAALDLEHPQAGTHRVVAAVLAQPSGCRAEAPTLIYDTNMQGWGPDSSSATGRRHDGEVDQFLTKMYKTNADFVFHRDARFRANCQTPVLILPDDIPAHPYAVAMEARCSRRRPKSACSRGRSRRRGFH